MKFKDGPPKLVFTTSAQSITASLCSGITTVQSRTSSGAAKNVSSNLTVNLSGPAGVTFYSDANCIDLITSVVIGTGTSTASFYFIAETAGSALLTAGATNYTNGQQSETLATNNYVWTGGGGDAFWSTNGNWSGGTAPGSGQIAVFNGSCSSNCSPTITSDPNVLGVRVLPSYGNSEVITQQAGVAITIGASGWIHAKGTFTGGNSTISMNGILGITNGTWTSTTGNLNIYNPTGCVTATTFRKVGGSFAHNNGTVKFSGGSNGYCNSYHSILSNAGVTFNHLRFDNAYTSYGNGTSFSADQTLTVLGNLTLSTTAGAASIDSMTIDLNGNLYMGSGSAGGTGTINIVGNTTQVYTGTTSTYAPRIVVNTSGTFGPDTGVTDFVLQGFTLQSGTFTAPTGVLNIHHPWHTSATVFNQTGGTFTHNNGTVKISATSNDYTHTYVTIAGSAPINFYHLWIENTYTTYGAGTSLTATQTVNVAGNLTIGASAGASLFGSGTINLTGNLYTNSGAAGGAGVVNIIGNAAQVYTGTSTTIAPNIVVNTSGTFSPDIAITDLGAQAFTLQSGTFTAPSGTFMLRHDSGNGSATIFTQTGGTFTHNSGTVKFSGWANGWGNLDLAISSSAPINFYSLSFDNTYTIYGTGTVFSANQALNAAGNLTIGASAGGSMINSTTINLSGNLTYASGAAGGSASVNFVGSGTQTITTAGGATAFTGASTVNQTGAGNISLANALPSSAASWSVSAGTINMNGYNLTLQGLALGGTTIYRQNGAGSPGTLTVNGTGYSPGSFLGGTVAD